MCVRLIIKCSLKIGNLIVAISGIVLLALGSLLIISEKTIGTYLTVKVSVGNFALGVGLLVFAVAVLGAFSICTGIKWLLRIYMVALAAFVIVDFALGGVALKARQDPELKTVINESLTEKFDDYLRNPTDPKLLATIAALQQALRCCGLGNATETFGTKDKIPISCYEDPIKDKEPFSEDCNKMSLSGLIYFLRLLGIVAFISAVVKIIVIIIAFMYIKIEDVPA